MERKTERADLKFYISSLQSEECLCGEPKKKGKSFCYKCYHALPWETAQGLYRLMGSGYEEAFEEAVRWLQQNKWD